MAKIKLGKLWKFIVFPVVIMAANLVIVNFIMKHYMSDLDVEMFLADSAPKFKNKIESVFDQESEKEKGTIELSEVVFPNINTEYGRFEIESVDINAPLMFGDGDEVLKNGVGQYSGSYIPGYGGTVLLTSHNYKFPEIEDVVLGDIIKVTTSYGVYKYKVSNIKILDKDEYSSLQISKDKEQLIYYTCYPFNALGSITTRYFIYADYVSGPVINK